MRNLGHINKIILGLAVVIISSCEGIFVPDPIDPQLPKYTEGGNDAAGAYVNNDIWQSVVKYFVSDGDAPMIISYPIGDSLTIKFYGEISYVRSAIEFHLSGLKINQIEDLLLLNGKKIQLDGVMNKGYYIKAYQPPIYTNKGIGQIYFRNVSKDSKSVITLSGTFGFTVNEQGAESTKISYGRFDYKRLKFHTE